jgi:MFS family permease
VLTNAKNCRDMCQVQHRFLHRRVFSSVASCQSSICRSPFCCWNVNLHSTSMPSPTTSPATTTASARVRQWLSQWFSSHATDWRSPARIEAERWLFFTPSIPLRYHRAMAVPAVIVVQMVLGSFYASYAFNHWYDDHVWGAPGANAASFMTCVGVYGASAGLFGNWVGRNGVFRSVLRQLCLTPVAWALAGAAGVYANYPLLLIGYGVCHGLGCAFAYLSSTSCLTQWYPELKGFMSGLAVCGAGVGSYVWVLVARLLMNPSGEYRLDPPHVQFVFAAIFAVAIACALPFLRNAPPGFKPAVPADVALRNWLRQATSRVRLRVRQAMSGRVEFRDEEEREGGAAAAPNAESPLPANCASAPTESQSQAPVPSKLPHGLPAPTPEAVPSSVQRRGAVPDRDYTFSAAAQTQEFVLTACLMAGQVITGATFLSSAADMTQNIFGFDASYAALVASNLNLVNFVGRFGWGFVTDKIGRKQFWLLSTASQACALVIMSYAIPARAFGAWLACFLLIGSLYGGGFGVIPAFLSDMFGPRISSATHGFMILVWSLTVVVSVPIFTSVTRAYSVPTTLPSGVTVAVPTPQAYAVNASWLAILPTASFCAALVLNVRAEDRRLRRALGGGALMRLPCSMLLHCCGVRRKAVVGSDARCARVLTKDTTQLLYASMEAAEVSTLTAGGGHSFTAVEVPITGNSVDNASSFNCRPIATVDSAPATDTPTVVVRNARMGGDDSILQSGLLCGAASAEVDTQKVVMPEVLLTPETPVAATQPGVLPPSAKL